MSSRSCLKLVYKIRKGEGIRVLLKTLFDMNKIEIVVIGRVQYNLLKLYKKIVIVVASTIKVNKNYP